MVKIRTEGLCLTICSILLCVSFAFADAGDTGTDDSTVNRGYEKAFNTSAKTSIFRNNRTYLHSEAIYFDMSVDGSDSVYTRGFVDLYDSTYWGNRFLSMDEYVGTDVEVLCFIPTSTCSILVYAEQSVLYDTLWSTTSGYNKGFVPHKDTLFSATGGIVGTGSTSEWLVKSDTFTLDYPILRFKFKEVSGNDSGNFYVAVYFRKPNEFHGK